MSYLEYQMGNQKYIMFLIFSIGLLVQIVNSNQNCASIIMIEKCENRQDCQVINQKCINRWKQCDQIQNASVKKCKKFNCDYDELLYLCKEPYFQKSILEQKIQESTNKKSFNSLSNHQQQRKFKNYEKCQKNEVKQQETYSKLELKAIIQQISEINNTQFEQLNFIINFAATFSLSYMIINLIIQ